MGKLEITTNRLKLVLATPEEVLAFLDAMSESDRAQVSPDWLARMKSSSTPDPWIHGFRLVELATDTVVGSCAYKGPPSAEGAVEIAYAVNESRQNRGYATEAARALVGFASGSGEVKLVLAHTLREQNASTRVLTKCGFQFAGDVIDPEDGPVWRWEHPVA